ncbi:Succinate dehydrogenase assembly factor 2 mitochondrial [Rhizina undulata]
MLSRLLPRVSRPPILKRTFTALPRLSKAPNPSSKTPVPRRDETYEELQKSHPLNPSLANTTSTNDPATGMPKAGAANIPPELLSAVEGEPAVSSGLKGPGLGGSFGGEEELEVGEMMEAKFRIEPLRRMGEDVDTMRARLLYQSRKRGILETDLLLSTFADTHLSKMTPEQLSAYDRFLDENDWDIYYWCTQTAPSTSTEYAEGGSASQSTPTAAGSNAPNQSIHSPSYDPQHPAAKAPPSPMDAPEDLYVGDMKEVPKSEMTQGETANTFGQGVADEWVQTVGRRREPYRPPPSRWRDSEILGMIRAHVARRQGRGDVDGNGGGLGRMPDVRTFDE